MDVVKDGERLLEIQAGNPANGVALQAVEVVIRRVPADALF